MTKVVWAFIKAYVYWLRNPLNYRVASQTHMVLHRDAVCEEISFIGVIQDIPDITEFTIIHKFRPIKTFYGEWYG